MPLFSYQAECGTRFQRFVDSWRTPNPPCPHCGSSTSRMPGRVALHGRAAPPPDATGAPTSWEGTYRGDREYIAGWRRRLEKRRDFEAKYPEHATEREALAAHEGVFERRPLTYRELAERTTSTGDATEAMAHAARDRIARSATPRSARPEAGD